MDKTDEHRRFSFEIDNENKSGTEELQKETQSLSTAATLNWCNFIRIVTPAGSDYNSSGLIIVINWTVSQKKGLPSPTAKNHQGFQTPCF